MKTLNMKRLARKLIALDSWIIYGVMILAVVVPMLMPELILPVTVTDPVRDLFDAVDRLPEGSRIFVTMDFEPSQEAEMTPIALAVLKHCFRKNLEVTGMTLWPQGVTLGYENMKRAAKHAYRVKDPGSGAVKDVIVDAKEYENWVFLGAQPGG